MKNRLSELKVGSPLIAPSILSADFARLAEEVRSIEEGEADWIHVDVMDGHFVPNLTIGPLVVEALRPLTKLPLDCHLMVSRPDEWVIPFAKAGADLITVHAEASAHLDRTLNHIREQGCRAGVSINPATPVQAIEPVLGLADLVLVMSVNPGFGGQKFIPYCAEKVKLLAQMRGEKRERANFVIEIDGGVNASNIGELRKAGVDIFVAGSAVFGSKDRKKSIGDLKNGLKAV